MIKQIFTELKNNTSTLTKKSIIEKYKDNDVFLECLFLALDPSIVFDIKKLPVPIGGSSSRTLKQALEALEAIYNRKYTGHAALNYVAELLGSLSSDDADVLSMVILKDLDCGVQEKIVNSVIAGLIKDEPYMRCSLLNQKTVKNITSFKTHGYAVSEVKMDGQFLNTSIISDSVQSTSRNGKVYDFRSFLDEELIKLKDYIQKKDPRFSSGVVVSGECLSVDEDGNILPREISNGISQKAGKGTISCEEAANIIFVLWDILPYENYQQRTWNVIRKERREIIEDAIANCNCTKIRMVKYKKVKNITDAFDFNREMMDNGEEGTIIKCENAIWKAHTSPKQLKMKLVMEFDMEIIGFKEGNKKRAGMLGSIELRSAEGIVTTFVGTGIKEKDDLWTFQTIWDKREELLGKIITIKANGITIDRKTGYQKIYLPVFSEIRFDKNDADTYERMLEIQESAVDVFRNSLTGLE